MLSPWTKDLSSRCAWGPDRRQAGRAAARSSDRPAGSPSARRPHCPHRRDCGAERAAPATPAHVRLRSFSELIQRKPHPSKNTPEPVLGDSPPSPACSASRKVCSVLPGGRLSSEFLLICSNEKSKTFGGRPHAEGLSSVPCQVGRVPQGRAVLPALAER